MDYISGKFHIFLFDFRFRFNLYEKKERGKRKGEKRRRKIKVSVLGRFRYVGKDVGGLVDDIILYRAMPTYMKRT